MGKKQASGLWQDKNYVNGWKRDWLNRHPELKDRRKRIMRQQRADFVEALEIEMGGACHRCGYSACLAALDLHHVNSQEKTSTVSDLAARRKWDAARLEADKCVLLCANCHREYEHGLWVGEFAKRAGVAHANLHRFRHTFAINYLRRHPNIYTLQRVLGHSSLDTVKIYLAISDVDVIEAHRSASVADNWRL